MSPSKRMFKHRLRGLSKSFGSQIDPEKSEQLKTTKSDIENNLSIMVKIMKKEEQSKKDGNSRKEKELVGLVDDFYNQYQSLYALYGRLTGEYVKAAPCILERLSSFSSSSSESEYFSAEEVDAIANNTDNNDYSYQKPFSRETERSTLTNNINNTHNELVLKTQSSNEFEELLSTQVKKLDRLNKQKRNLELQVESQAREVKHLCAKNAELHGRVLQLEMLLKESKGTVSVLEVKLKNNEDQATSKVAELMARINKLEQEAKKTKLEEKLRRNKNEAMSQKKEFSDQINVMQQKLDSLSDHNRELEAELDREREEVSKCLVRIENLGENVAENKSVEKNLLIEKECFLARIKDLELEVESRCSKQRDLEDGKNGLEREMAEKREEISELLREHESCNEEASIEAKALKAEVENLRLELDTLLDQKNMLELQNEKAENWWKKVKLCQELSERKMEELAEEFGKKMEDKIDLLQQRIHVAEQVNNENKESQKMTEQRYEEENKRLREKELYLREKVWKLDEKVSKEGGEKLNLVKAVKQLERKVCKLENNLRDKDQDLVSLAEKKREAIRQLCFLIEFHRNRSVYLKDLLSNRMASNNRK